MTRGNQREIDRIRSENRKKKGKQEGLIIFNLGNSTFHDKEMQAQIMRDKLKAF